MNGRVNNAIEGLTFGLAFAAIAWVIAFAVRRTTGKKIDSRTYYGVAVAAGFVCRRLLIVYFSG